MRILRKHLLFCTLITLLSGNVADKSPFHDGIFTQNVDSQNDDLVKYRLPTDVKPISYDIMLYDIMLIPKLDEDDFTFKGIAKIEAIIENPTNKITLHVGKIEIVAVSINYMGQSHKFEKSNDKVTEKYTITVSKPIPKDTPLTISFTYKGILSDNMIGFYRSSYFDQNGKIQWLAATQFQTTHARHAFPCFDEPRFKAKFTIRISRDEKDYRTLSNMPLQKSEMLIPGKNTWDVFNQSEPMSTYLVAFIVHSKFSSLGEENEFQVWSKPSTIKQARYALKIGKQALELFEDKFEEKYRFPKMDMVAIPDFAAGAMENWGLVTYRESRMLYDENESSVAAQQSVASVIAHELSHMWFGNLVTPEWWSYLWLSEGFARYFQYFAVAELEKEWKMEEQFVVEQHQTALIADGLESSLPMTRNVSNKLQIAGIGDTITYNKGASIVRMMSLLFGTDNFKNALKIYLTNNKDKGLVDPDKLWAAIQEAIKDDKELNKTEVNKVMDTWTKKPGYPVMTVAINDDGNEATISQKRFLLRNLEKTPKNITWFIPITVAQSQSDFDNVKFKYFLSIEKSSLSIKPEQWAIFNVQSSGFYRVNYNDLGWQRIFNVLKSDNMNDVHVLNRAAIVDDLLNLGRAGEYPKYDKILEGLLYLKSETHYLPFKAAFNGLEYLNKRFSGHAEHALFKVYVISLLNNINLQLGYEEKEKDDRLNVLLRREINNWLCNFGDEECIEIYTQKFREWRANTTAARIKANDRPTTYCLAIRLGTPEDWDFLWGEYFNSNYATDQTVILNALGCSQNTTILEKYLKYAITKYEDKRIRKQDSTSVFAAVYNSGLLGAEYVLTFVDKYHKEMEQYYRGQDTIATILDGASQRLSTNELVNKFEKLIEKHKVDFVRILNSLNYSLKIAKYELEWYEKNSPSIIDWLKEYPKLSYPLPSNIIPTNYDITLTPYLTGDFHVDGKVIIEADVKQSTNQIILHSSELKDHKVNVMKISGSNSKQKVIISTTQVIKQFDFFVINLRENLPIGTHLTIDIEYKGHLNATELRGFYKSSYENEKKETKWLAASHLEPVGARKMFPCFDEPALKAYFTIHVNVLTDKKYKAISNMELKTSEKSDDGSYTKYTFSKSVPMSTYLVAVIVSDFESKSIDNNKTDKTDFAVYARPNAIDQTDYALSLMSPLVNFFETAYKQNYQLSKLFMAALPDFGSGAMENWGLLTFRETSMLYDENHSPITNKQDIRNVIAHEISHQWFGNLVSPQLWKYLWLNEGFARYFEYHAPARAFADKTMESQFVVDQVHSAFGADSSKSTHPMSHDVASPSEIRSIFDTISYAKAGSVLRMVEKIYGLEVFNAALSDYLNKRKYNSATPEHLYASLQQQIDKKKLEGNIQLILDSWTTQSGYPVVTVNVEKDSIVLEQKRFFLKDTEKNSDSTIWHIPITWASVKNNADYSNTTPKHWLTKTKDTIKMSPDSLLTFNNQQSGYYRVNYNKEHWLKLIDYLKNQDIQPIHEINRAAIVDDLMNLARTDDIDYETAISATMYLEKEDNYFPWRAFFNNLPYLNNRFAGRDIEGLYKKWLTSLIGPLYARLGFEDREKDDNLTKILRIHTRKWACKLDIADCKFYAAKYFQQKQHSGTIPPNYRDVVYCTAVRTDNNNKANYKFLLEEYSKSSVTTDKLVILSSLACSENKTVLEELLREAVKEESSIRYQDSAKVFSNVYDASLIGVEAIMEVIKTDYDNILRRHYNDYTKIANIMSALASRLSTPNLYSEYQKLLVWLIDNKEPRFKESRDSYLATAQYEFDWYEKKVPVIFKTLDYLFSSNIYRLPKTLNPQLYTIDLTPYIEKGVFEGKVQINMTVREDTTLIALNSHKLFNFNIKVIKNAEEIPLLDYTEKLIPQQLRIYLSNYVHKNDVIIAEIKFSGTINDNMNGFYRSSYRDSKGEQHWLATTHFQPTYARQAFPCFDEPAFKSKFKINIQRPKHYNSLSNMVLETTTNIPGNDEYKRDTFYTTIDMSTYLIAFVVSEFKPAINSNIELNVWGRPEIATHGKNAQHIGMSLMSALQNITNFDYPLSKLDLVGIPDFSMGAMENWGLATFREYGLFANEKETSSTLEKYIITVIAHELTHMWFGNLVTCDWWEYIWLNEGFAQYFEWFASDRILPDYHFMDQFVVYELHPALAQDATISTHPMTNPVNTPEEIDGIFDYVTYGKSASVLRMFFNLFEKEAHISALRQYLEKLKYRTARPEDLWESFKPFISISIDNRIASIEEVMNTWTNQPGYPVVHATLKNNILTLSQERFIMNKNTTSDEFYWIPIDVFVPADFFNISPEHKTEPKSQSMLTGISFEHKVWRGPKIQSMLSFDDTVSLDHKVWLGPEPKRMYINPTNDWYVVNYKQTGFYRVNYDTESWKGLINKLTNKAFEDINVLNRAQIIDDLFNLARADYVNYELLMHASTYLKQETHHLPWKAFFNGLSYVYGRFEQRNYQQDLEQYVLNLLSNMYKKVGFDDRGDEKHLDKLNRELILQWACKLNKPECVKKSTDLYAAWQKNLTHARIPRNARSAVYCTALKKGSYADWDFLWNQYQNENFATEKKIILTALGCSTNKTVLQNYLREAIKIYSPGNAIIRRQDVSAVFTSVYSQSSLGVNATLDFLINNTEALYQYYRQWSDVANLFVNVASYISNEDQHNNLLNYVKLNMNQYPLTIRKKLAFAVSTAETNLLWYANNNKTIGQWLVTTLKPKPNPNPQGGNSARIESLNVVSTILIALVSYILSYY